MIEDADVCDEYSIGVGECNDGEIIYIQGELDGEVEQEILMTRSNAIDCALLILELCGYEEESHRR